MSTTELKGTVILATDTSAKVGIGKTPGFALDVSGQTRLGTPNNLGGLFILGTTASGSPNSHDFVLGEGQYGRSLIMRMNPDLTVASGSITDTISTAKTEFFHWGSSKVFTIMHNGNIGIGTRTPTSTLDVNGTIKATSIECTSYDSTTATTTMGFGGNMTSGKLNIGHGMVGTPDHVWTADTNDWGTEIQIGRNLTTGVIQIGGGVILKAIFISGTL